MEQPFTELIVEVQRRKRLSKAKLAKELGISKRTLQRWTTGASPTNERLVRWALIGLLA